LWLGCRRDEEMERLLGIGARVVEDQRRADGSGWVVLAGPEGNEFCIERSDVERGPSVEQLGRALEAVGELIAKVGPEQGQRGRRARSGRSASWSTI
jgi:Glyoxalase-like domain